MKQDRPTVHAASTASATGTAAPSSRCRCSSGSFHAATFRPLVLARPNLTPTRPDPRDPRRRGGRARSRCPSWPTSVGCAVSASRSPTRQRLVQRPDRRYYLDAEFDPWAVTVEINGVQHLDVRQKEFDDVRRTQLAIGGRLVVDIGSYIVRHDIALAVLLDRRRLALTRLGAGQGGTQAAAAARRARTRPSPGRRESPPEQPARDLRLGRAGLAGLRWVQPDAHPPAP